MVGFEVTPEAPIDHRNPADLMALHRVEDLLYIVLGRAGDRIFRHDILNEGTVRVATLGNDVYCQIAIGHDSDEFAVLPAFAHRYRSDIFRFHDFRYPGRSIARRAARRVLGHYIGTVHRMGFLSRNSFSLGTHQRRSFVSMGILVASSERSP